HRRLAFGEQARDVRARRRRRFPLLEDGLEGLEDVGRRARPRQRVEKARARPGVTRDAFLMDLYDERVAVAIGVDALHVLDVARRLALLPWRLPRARPEVRETGRQRPGDRVAIHPRDHEDFARLGLLNDRRAQATLVVRPLRGRHPRTST